MAGVMTDRRDDLAERAGAVALTFDQVSALALRSLPTESSSRTYRITFKHWRQFAQDCNFDAMDLFYENIRRFLYSRSLSHSTRVSRKSHMLKLVLLVSNRDFRFAQHYLMLREHNIQPTASDTAPRRKPRILSDKARRRLLAVWHNDDTHKGIRNRAVIRLLLYTAIHSSELTALRWEDLDWRARTICVSRGSHGQRYSLPIFDRSRHTISALRKLQSAQKRALSYHDAPYKRILPALSTGRNACFQPGKDVRTSAQTIRTIISLTAKKAGLGALTARDLRFTSLHLRAKAGAADTRIQSLADEPPNE